MNPAIHLQAWNRLWPTLADTPPSIVAVTEHDAIRCAVGNCKGLTVLDLGCGIGQPTETFARARGVYAVDISREALRRYRNPVGTPVMSIHAGALDLPFPDRTFDIVVAAQLLPHLSADERRAAVREIARVLKHGGKAVITALHYNFRFPKLGMPKSGSDDGIYFFRHTVDELRQEVSPVLQIEHLWGVWNYLPKTYQLFMRLGRKTLYWDRIVRRTPLSLHYGKQLTAMCRLAWAENNP
jgi:ubiquinone/menaquinone biosynthesis C-methylase UbiE